MRVYIAGPMSGYPEFNRPAFRAAAEALTAAGWEVITPVHDDDLDADGNAVHEYAWYLRRDLRQLLDADGVALLPGWESSNGASLEHFVAERLGMDIRVLEAWR